MKLSTEKQKIKRSLIYLILGFRWGSAIGADGSQVSPNNPFPAVSLYIDMLRKRGRRSTISLGPGVPEGKQVTGETVASRYMTQTGPELWGNWIKLKENGKKPTHVLRKITSWWEGRVHMTGAWGCFFSAANTWSGHLLLRSPQLLTVPLYLPPSANNIQNPTPHPHPPIVHRNTMADNIPGPLKKEKGNSHQ